MKSYLVIVFGASLCLITACRKERTCTCTVTDSGIKTVHTKNAGLVINFPPAPTLTLSAPVDETTTNSYFNESTEVITYDRMKPGIAKQVCTSESEKKVNTSETNFAGTTTITTAYAGSEKTVCKLD